MTIRQTADALGLKVRTIRQWVRLGKIKAEKHGQYWYIFDDEIMREEIQANANKGREHSRRIKEAVAMGMCEQDRQDSEKSI